MYNNIKVLLLLFVFLVNVRILHMTIYIEVYYILLNRVHIHAIYNLYVYKCIYIVNSKVPTVLWINFNRTKNETYSIVNCNPICNTKIPIELPIITPLTHLFPVGQCTNSIYRHTHSWRVEDDFIIGNTHFWRFNSITLVKLMF